MKKIILLLIASLMLLSCEKDAIVSTNDFNLTAYIFPNNVNSKSLGEPFNIQLKSDDTGFTKNLTYKVKYSSNLAGVLKIDNVVINPNQYYDIEIGNTDFVYTSEILGKHDLKFEILNSSNLTKELIVPVTFTAPSLIVQSSDDSFTLKETDIKNFRLTIKNYNPLIKYQIKIVKSETIKNGSNVSPNSKLTNERNDIIDSNFSNALVTNQGEILLNYQTLSLNEINTVNDYLTIFIQDDANTVVSLLVNVAIKPLPIVYNAVAIVTRKSTDPKYPFFYDITNSSAFGVGVNIVAYELVWNIVDLPNPEVGITFTQKTQTGRIFDGSGYSVALADARYKTCTARVKDSDGYWSKPFVFQSIFVE